MNTALTQAIIQLARNKRCTGGSGCVGERQPTTPNTLSLLEITHTKEHRHMATHVCVTHELIHSISSQFSPGNKKKNQSCFFFYCLVFFFKSRAYKCLSVKQCQITSFQCQLKGNSEINKWSCGWWPKYLSACMGLCVHTEFTEFLPDTEILADARPLRC